MVTDEAGETSAGCGSDHEMRGRIDSLKRRSDSEPKRIGLRAARMAVAAAQNERREVNSGQSRRRQRKPEGTRPVEDINRRGFHGVSTRAPATGDIAGTAIEIPIMAAIADRLPAS